MFNLKTEIVFISICILSNNALARVYKCEINGKKTYQMKPCSVGRGGEIDVIDKQPKVSVAEIRMRAKNGGMIDGIDLRTKSPVTIGMSENDVVKLLGQPDDISTNPISIQNQIRAETWRYSYGRKNQIIYFKDGKVTGIN